MYVHPISITVALFVALCGGCRTTHAVPAPEGALAPKIAASSLSDLCRGRPRCAVAKRQVVTGAADTSLAEVRIEHAPDASADEDRCDRREYWVLRPMNDVLVAVDCETQWGADNPGPAAVKLRGAQIHVNYVEFQSNDRCESYTATLSLIGPKLTVVQSRAIGEVKKDSCLVGKESAPVDPLGEGSGDRPLLTLHR